MTILDNPLNTLALGDIITFPGHQLRVVAVAFERDAAFPDAVAQVAIETGDAHALGTHVSTPFGPVLIVADDRGLEIDDRSWDADA